MVYGVREINVSGSGGEPVNLIDTENGESLMRVQPAVDLVLSNLPPHSPGSGTLYVTTKQVIWVSDLDKTKGFAVDFLSISLHAVSRDPDAYPLPCLYTQIETEADDDDLHSNDSDSESNNHALDLSTVREMRLIPSDPTQLDSLFQTFCDCAELNPEPNAAAAEEEGEQHNWIFSAYQMEDDEEPEEEGYIAPNLATSISWSFKWRS